MFFTTAFYEGRTNVIILNGLMRKWRQNEVCNFRKMLCGGSGAEATTLSTVTVPDVRPHSHSDGLPWDVGIIRCVPFQNRKSLSAADGLWERQRTTVRVDWLGESVQAAQGSTGIAPGPRLGTAPTRVCVCVCVLVTQSCLTLCNSMDCSSPGYLFIFLTFYFYFILLYNIVLVLPYIDMNPPRVYMS